MSGQIEFRLKAVEERQSMSSSAARHWLFSAVALLPTLAGCAASPASSQGHALQYTSGSSRTEAFQRADKKCNEYGRAAEAGAYDDLARLLAFRCIEP
jgi:hypothetical protein